MERQTESVTNGIMIACRRYSRVAVLAMVMIFSGCASSSHSIEGPWQNYNEDWMVQFSYSAIQPKDAMSQPKIEVHARVKNSGTTAHVVKDIVFAAENDKSVIVSLQTERPGLTIQPGSSFNVTWQWNLGVGSGFDPFEEQGNIKIHKLTVVPVLPETGRN